MLLHKQQKATQIIGGLFTKKFCPMTTPILRKRTNYLSFISNLFFKLSINIAPNGAVINIATTAAVSTNVPQASPSDKAIAPIDAWTVAFGR